MTRRSPKPRSRGTVLSAALRAIRLLRRGRWTMPELGDALGRKRRTGYRLVESLEREGLRVDREHEGREVYYRITREAVEEWLGMA